MMKKILILVYALILVIGYYNVAFADACFRITRNGDPELSPQAANALENTCKNSPTEPPELYAANCEAWWQYDSRVRDLDIEGMKSGSCNWVGPQEPGSFFIWVDVIGVDINGWVSGIEEPTGVIDADGRTETYVKREARFQLEINNIPAQIQSQIDANSHFEFQWADVCNWFINHSSGLTGAECP